MRNSYFPWPRSVSTVRGFFMPGEKMKIKFIKTLMLGDFVAVIIPMIVIGLVFFGLAFPPGIIQSISYKSFLAIFACLLLWSTLRLMDLVSGINFKTWWGSHESSQGVYLACRIIAYAIVICFVFAFA